MIGQHSTNTLGRLLMPDFQSFGSSPRFWTENVQQTLIVPVIREELVVSNPAHSKTLFLMENCHFEYFNLQVNTAHMSVVVYQTFLSHIKTSQNVYKKTRIRFRNTFTLFLVL